MDCPSCHAPMLSGYLYSGLSMHWFYDSDGAMKKALGLGQNLSGIQFRPGGEKQQGWYCKTCGHLLLDKIALKPPAG